MNAYFDIDRGNKWGELFIKTAHERGFKIDDLYNLDHQQITKIASKIKHTMIADGTWLSPEVGFAPIADGKFLPFNPIKNFKDSSIRLIVGTTSDEYRLWSEFENYYIDLNEDNFYKRLKKIFKEDAVDQIAKIYLSHEYDGNKFQNGLSNLMTDWTFGIHALELLEQHKDKSYAYYFNEPSPLLDGKLGAYHASELPYVFGSANKKIFKDFCSEKSSEISNFFQVSWSQFAKTGSPSSHLMDWDVYKKNSSIIYINSTPEIKTFKNKDRIKLLNETKLKS